MISLPFRPQDLVYREKSLPIHLPVLEIFKRVKRAYENVFFLESLGEDSQFARYSYIGFRPYHTFRAFDFALQVDDTTFETENPYFALRFLHKYAHIPCDRFCGGLVGYLTYEATKYFEPGNFYKSQRDFPDFEFGLYLDGLVFDKKNQTLHYFYLLEDRSEELFAHLMSETPSSSFQVVQTGVDTSKEQFEDMVKKALTHIYQGDSFQIVLSRKIFLEIVGDCIFFYERLRELNPSPHMFYLRFDKRELIGSSPELIVRLENGVIENFPLAGTRKRGLNQEEDEEIAKKLLESEKERAEHMMLVDLGRNDLGRVSQFGSVEVRRLMQIRKLSHVQHIGSELTGKLESKRDMFDVLAASSPMGTVTGAPKVETMKIIHNLEPYERGPYSGSVGFFSLNGNCNFAILIRSLFRNGNKAYLQAGAGIVYDSLPAHEYLETERKLAGLLSALGLK
ncbi:anthranilate synthase component I family protein [Candidatus Peregrinibacteria bacterium]|nr:anthranilate synthase component I family protein [Candidatus Peregrinibacteria bacterium]